MTKRAKQTLLAIAVMLVSGIGIALTWYTVLTAGYFYTVFSIIMPAFFVVGFALLIFPGYKEERMARGEDIAGRRGWRLITPRWWVIAGIAVAAGVAHYFLVQFA